MNTGGVTCGLYDLAYCCRLDGEITTCDRSIGAMRRVWPDGLDLQTPPIRRTSTTGVGGYHL